MFVVYESVSWCLMGGLSPCGWGGIVTGQTLAVVFPLPVIHARLSVVGSPLLFILLSGVGTLSCVIVIVCVLSIYHDRKANKKMG